jgi:uncharacterized membrane protein
MSELEADREVKLESLISYLLIIGVLAAVILEVIGITLYYGTYGNVAYSQAPNVYITGENFFAFVVERIQNLFVTENAIAFMTAGIIVLVLVPFVRAIASCLYFAWEKNWKYVIITLFVIVVLTISLAFH